MASEEGTLRFRKRHESGVAKGHFREFDRLSFSGLGMGTYLGEPDAVTDELVFEAALESVRSGVINVIDTAINYRFQKAERSVGRALEHLFSEIERDELFISTKGGHLTPDGDIRANFRSYIAETLVKPGILDPSDLVGGMHCMSPSFLEDQLTRSLRNLGLESVDLLYLHNAAESQIPEVGRQEFFSRLALAFELYAKERKRGRIGYYGMATWSCFRVTPDSPEYLNLEDVIKLAEKTEGKEHGFRFIQLPYNLAMPEAFTLANQTVDGEALTILQAAQRLGIGVFVSAPLLQGNLLQHPDIPIVKELGSNALTCLQFVRSTPGVIAPLVGHKKPEHVRENLRLASVSPLSWEQFTKEFLKTE